MAKNILDRSDSHKIIFLIVGKINQRKKVFDLLKAVAQLPPKYQQEIELLIAGSGETQQAIAFHNVFN